MNPKKSHRRYKRILLPAIILLLAFPMFPSRSAAVETQSLVTAHFSRPMKPEQVAELVRKFNIELRELQYVSGTIQGGYTVRDGENIDSALNNLINSHREFLQFAIDKNNAQLAQMVRGQKDYARLLVLQRQFQKAYEELNLGNFSVSGFEAIHGPGFSTLLLNNVIMDVAVVQRPQPRESQFRPDSFSHEPWAPYGGGSDVSQYYTYQTFYFNNVTGYTSNSTYEHETQVYDVKFADYDNYWSSNLPRAYKDTQFLDIIDNFTVGSAQASSLYTYTQYYAYMRLRPGSASSATVRIKGQKGHRTPSWCYLTWCIFADATTGSMAAFTAPAGMSWQY